jgi:hypothetical protein
MSGVIDVEGRPKRATHPLPGEVGAAPSLRRAFEDFPPLAWFTTRIEVPSCLVRYILVAIDRQIGEPISTAAAARYRRASRSTAWRSAFRWWAGGS